jgi:hypothetical protein
MDTFINWLDQDYHWTWFIIIHVIGSALALYMDVYDGPVIMKRWERNLHFLAILLWEITLVCAVLFLIGFMIAIGFDRTRNFFRRMKQTYSLP